MQSSYHGVEKEVGAGDGSREKEKKDLKRLKVFPVFRSLNLTSMQLRRSRGVKDDSVREDRTGRSKEGS